MVETAIECVFAVTSRCRRMIRSSRDFYVLGSCTVQSDVNSGSWRTSEAVLVASHRG